MKTCPMPWGPPLQQQRLGGMLKSAPQATSLIGLILELSASLNGVATDVEDEVVIESGLHVSGVAAASCYAKYGNPFTHEAPPLDIDWVDDDESLDQLRRHGSKDEITDEEVDLAVCLATPMEIDDDSMEMNFREKLKTLTARTHDEEGDGETGLSMKSIEEIEEAEEEAEAGGARIVRLRRKRENGQVGDHDGMAGGIGMDEVNNICPVHFDGKNALVSRSKTVGGPPEEEMEA